MNGNYLLDTNIVIALFKEDQAVIEGIQEANEVSIPAIVLGELYYGAYKSSLKSKNELKIDELGTEGKVLDITKTTSKLYGKIKNQLKEQGTPIPENDIWIAALALEFDLTLVTRDKHFNHIKGVTLEKW